MKLQLFVIGSILAVCCHCQNIQVRPTADSRCGPNERYTECGTACPATCASVRSGVSTMICMAMCKVGCECLPGYALDEEKNCVKLADCLAANSTASECGANEEMKQCGACDNTCANVRAGEGMMCNRMCRPKECGCKAGYARDENGRCVSEKECKQNDKVRDEPVDVCADNTCGPNQRCVPEPKACLVPPCPQYRCQCPMVRCANACPNGFARDEYGCQGCECVNGTANTCGRNEEMKKCGSCDNTCERVRSGDLTVCILSCRPPACGCKAGYARDEDGQCVSEKACKITDDPAVPTHCPSGRPELPGYFCGLSPVRKECPETHYCEISPVDAYAVCCPKNECGPNEQFMECGGCEPKCADQGRLVPCPMMCRLNVCQCKAGYARDDNGRCVLAEECPAPARDDPVDACANNPCGPGGRCVPEPKQCITTPCLQYRCEPGPTECALFKCSGDACPNGFAVDENGCQDGCKCAGSSGSDESSGSDSGECGRNEEMKMCGPCDNTCANVRAGENTYCTMDCREPACGCKTGYARDDNGKCVLESRCRIQKRDRSVCRPNPCPEGKRCVPEPKNCVTTPCPQYACKDKKDPSELRCRRHEQVFQCGACDNTCANVRAGDAMICTEECRAPECGCQAGYARDDNGKCVPEARCNRSGNGRRSKDCRLGPVVGDCDALIPSFYYDPKSKGCKTFNYGGCGGNGNRFETEAECMKKCGPRNASPVMPAAAPCGLPKVVGLCKALIPSWYYNSSTGQCETFNYGGCGGNANRFASEAECQQTCPPRKG